MSAEKTKTLPLPPIVGAIAVVGGIVVLEIVKNLCSAKWDKGLLT